MSVIPYRKQTCKFKHYSIYISINHFHYYKIRCSSVSVVTRLRAGRLDFDSRQGLRFFSSPPHSDRLWSPYSLLSRGYRRFFLQGLSGRGVKLTTHLHLVPRSRMCGALSPLPPYFSMAWCLVKYRIHLRCNSAGYGLGDRGFESRQGLGIYLLTTAS